ncbi:MAG TPA: AAA family ATPase [Caulobacteraceae bacterium]|jgi:hypothetical protein|nr:AAA family ATPase [Caulobacteraceae bacterium]
MDRATFITRLKSALSSSQAITKPELLKGRTKDFRLAQEALEMPGRQIFICGLRGVGKSSLALTTAMDQAGVSDRRMVPTIQCWRGATFGEVVRDLCNSFLSASPLAKDETTQVRGGVDFKIVSGGIQSDMKSDSRFRIPASVNEAAECIRWVSEQTGKRIAIVDEFDLLANSDCHEQMAQLVKMFADGDYGVKLMFCGVGDSATELMRGHSSAFRYFHTINLDRLPIGPSLEIVDGAAKALKIEIDRDSTVRIAQISDGFPYFAHLVTEKLLWSWFNDSDRDSRHTDARHFDEAVQQASEETEPELKDPYDLVVKRFKTNGEHVIWAMADGPNLDKNIDGAYRDYVAIMDRRHEPTLSRKHFNNRLIELRRDQFGHILSSRRLGWYEFTEKRMRGYARLRAVRQGEYLRSEHPKG